VIGVGRGQVVDVVQPPVEALAESRKHGLRERRVLLQQALVARVLDLQHQRFAQRSGAEPVMRLLVEQRCLGEDIAGADDLQHALLPVAAEPVQLDLPMHQDEEMPRRIALMMQRGALQQAAAAGAERQFLQRRLG